METMSDPAYSIEDLQQRLPELLTALSSGKRVVLRLKEGGEVVLMSKDELESLEATLETLSDPEMMAGLRRALDEESRGEFAAVDDLR